MARRRDLTIGTRVQIKMNARTRDLHGTPPGLRGLFGTIIEHPRGVVSEICVYAKIDDDGYDIPSLPGWWMRPAALDVVAQEPTP